MTTIPRRFALPLGAALLLGVGALTACGDSDTGAATGSEDKPAAEKALGGAELIEKVRGSTVSVVAQPPGETRAPKIGGVHSHGSGIIYDARRGLVLTSNHLVEGAGSIKVRVNEKTEVQGRAVARAQCDDLALLALNPKPAGLVDIPLADLRQVREGEDVTALGYFLPPDGRQRLITGEGAVSAIDVPGSIAEDLPNLPSVVLHQAPVESYLSGGPLVNERAELVGLNVVVGETGDGPATAVSSKRLSELLGRLEPGTGSRFKGWGSEHGECHSVMTELSRAALVSHGGSDDNEARLRRFGAGDGGGGGHSGHGG